MKNIYIVGTGSQARYIIEILKNSLDFKVKGLIDIEDKKRVGKFVNQIQIVGHLDDIASSIPKDSCIIIGYGKNNVKKDIAIALKEKGYKFATALSNSAYISDYVEIGEGSIINPHVTIMPNTKIGNHVIIHSGSVIEHDNTIGDFSNIAPGVITAGNVSIGEGSYICTGAIIKPGIKVGKECTVGAGAVVLENILERHTVVGNPARVIKNGK